MTLKDKRVLLVGGFNHLGRAILQNLLYYNADVVVLDREDNFKNQENKDFLKRVDFIELDVYDVNVISTKFSAIAKEVDVFHALIFAIGIGTIRPLTLVQPSTIASMLEVNCLNFVEIVRIMVIKKRLQKGAGIVAISSISSILGLKSKLAYSISKAALNSAVQNLAAELSSKGIRVNAILKGALTIDADLNHVKNIYSLSNETLEKQVLGASTPDDLGNLTCFLISDLVMTMTGSLIKMDGGYSL